MFWSKKAAQEPVDTSKVVKEGDIEYLSVTCPTCDQPHKIAQVVRVAPDEFIAYASITSQLHKKIQAHYIRWLRIPCVCLIAASINYALRRHGVDTGVTGIHIFVAFNLLAMAQVLETPLILMRLQKKVDKIRASMREKYASAFLPEARDGKLDGVYMPIEPTTA